MFKKRKLSHVQYPLFPKAGKYEIHFKEDSYSEFVLQRSADFTHREHLVLCQSQVNEVLLYLENKESGTFVVIIFQNIYEQQL